MLRKAGAIVATTAALMFSAMLLMVVLSLGAVAFVYLWWKARGLRKQMRDFPPHGANVEREVFKGEAFAGEVIEGEAIRVNEQLKRIVR